MKYSIEHLMQGTSDAASFLVFYLCKYSGEYRYIVNMFSSIIRGPLSESQYLGHLTKRWRFWRTNVDVISE